MPETPFGADVSRSGYHIGGDPVRREPRWRIRLARTRAWPAPSVGCGDRVLIGDVDGCFRAIDLISGEQLWASSAEASAIDACFAPDMVHLRSSQRISLVEFESGRELGTAGISCRAPVGTMLRMGDSLFVADGRRVFAADALNGGERWMVELP